MSETTGGEKRCEDENNAVRDLLKTIISRIRTMKPTTPPPAPYCQLLPWFVAMIGAAETRLNIRN